MPKLGSALIISLLLAAIMMVSESTRVPRVLAGALSDSNEVEAGLTLSPIWKSNITQWSDQIMREARESGLDPDFIAAVVEAESLGNQHVVSRVGAVGLMGVMPMGPGLEWRPSPELLVDPAINLSWGVAILAEITRQSGGDIVAALAAYSGGWDQANRRVPQEYASSVLNSYGRAVAARSGISPDIADRWTVAAEISRGHIPAERLILSEQPVSGLRKYGEHIIYNYTDQQGRAYYVKGYAVPLALVVPLELEAGSADADSVDQQLLARLGVGEVKLDRSNPRVVQACLPSLSRLRGRLATRWYAPAACPSWHR
jgi:hypothetical protein